jgi:hypothetical protein
LLPSSKWAVTTVPVRVIVWPGSGMLVMSSSVVRREPNRCSG